MHNVHLRYYSKQLNDNSVVCIFNFALIGAAERDGQNFECCSLIHVKSAHTFLKDFS